MGQLRVIDQEAWVALGERLRGLDPEEFAAIFERLITWAEAREERMRCERRLLETFAIAKQRHRS